jgi:hypothetical protein
VKLPDLLSNFGDPREGAQDGVEVGGSKGGRGRLIGRTKGGLNSKLHALADAKGRPIRVFLPAGQTSDYIGARALLASIQPAAAPLGDRRIRGPIRPVPAVCTTAQAAQRKKCLFNWKSQAIFAPDGMPLGEYRPIAAHQSGHAFQGNLK